MQGVNEVESRESPIEQRRVRKTTSLVNSESDAAHISDEVVRKLQLAA